jgi:5-formyltetrahydrofolate cyclo-ligase
LRRRFKALREGVSASERQVGSERICRHLAAFCETRVFTAVGAFWPYGSEVDLRPLMALQPHLSFFFPRIASVEPPRLVWGQQPLEPGSWGLLEPVSAPHALPPVQLLLVPGLAFADDGQRLGYGKGFYDAVLDGLDPAVVTVGVGFAFQRCPSLPADPRDRPVQALVNEQGLRWL